MQQHSGIVTFKEKEAVNAPTKEAIDDGIHYFTAPSGGASLLITRNIKDYQVQNLPVITPWQFLESPECH